MGTESRLVREAVRQAKGGDHEALHFLYVRYVADVLDCVRAEIGEDREAEQLTRDLFKDLARLIEGHEIDREPFRTWILRVAKAAALGQLHSGSASASLGV